MMSNFQDHCTHTTGKSTLFNTESADWSMHNTTWDLSIYVCSYSFTRQVTLSFSTSDDEWTKRIFALLSFRQSFSQRRPITPLGKSVYGRAATSVVDWVIAGWDSRNLFGLACKKGLLEQSVRFSVSPRGAMIATHSLLASIHFQEMDGQEKHHASNFLEDYLWMQGQYSQVRSVCAQQEVTLHSIPGSLTITSSFPFFLPFLPPRAEREERHNSANGRVTSLGSDICPLHACPAPCSTKG